MTDGLDKAEKKSEPRRPGGKQKRGASKRSRPRNGDEEGREKGARAK
jgi:hypothetical protein